MGVKETDAACELKMAATEHIVAASVETGKYFPINIHFLVFQHI